MNRTVQDGPGRSMTVSAVLTVLTISTVSTVLSAQCPDGSPPPCRGARTAAAAPVTNSVAVLYFDNSSADTADAYLADGITEEIISRLGQVGGRVQVKSRYAVRRYRGAVTAVARQILPTDQAAEDAAQEALLLAFKALPQLEEPGRQQRLRRVLPGRDQLHEQRGVVDRRHGRQQRRGEVVAALGA